MSENVYQIDFNKPESVHFIGIGGISMSGLAEILMDEGFTVSGSDAHRSELTDNLEVRGAIYRIRFRRQGVGAHKEAGGPRSKALLRTESGEYPGWHRCGSLHGGDSPG